jgi:hypothetical protein
MTLTVARTLVSKLTIELMARIWFSENEVLKLCKEHSAYEPSYVLFKTSCMYSLDSKNNIDMIYAHQNSHISGRDSFTNSENIEHFQFHFNKYLYTWGYKITKEKIS